MNKEAQTWMSPPSLFHTWWEYTRVSVVGLIVWALGMAFAVIVVEVMT